MVSESGRSPFERLRAHYDHELSVCPACGHEDEEGGWTAETDGAGVVYRHVCPSCGAEQEHKLQLSDRETARRHAAANEQAGRDCLR